MTWKQLQHWDKRLQRAGYRTTARAFATSSLGTAYELLVTDRRGHMVPIATVEGARAAERMAKEG